MVAKAFLRLLIVALPITTRLAQGTASPEASKAEVYHYCMDVIKKNPPYKSPSPKCIDVLLRTDLASVCSVLNAIDEATISVARFVTLGRQFGKKITSGAKCGSKCPTPFHFY